MFLREGTLLQGGKYKIVRHIMSGGFGNTYQGLDVSLAKQVAIKEFFVKDFCVRDESSTLVTVTTSAKAPLIEHLKARFMDEARAIAHMEHENIVKVQALFEENGTAYYVMDFIEGETVSNLLKRNGPMSEEEALSVIIPVARALDYLHRQNRYHLDVKPGNIMLRNDGKVLLIDFGSSKQYAEVEGENTSTFAPCYTPGYAPSEQMNPKPSAFSAATDVYALGATLYRMLTGEKPPSAIDLLNGEATLPPLPAHVSPRVAECVRKAMIPQRSQRLQTVAEFLTLGNSVAAPQRVESNSVPLPPPVLPPTSVEELRESTVVMQTPEAAQPFQPIVSKPKTSKTKTWVVVGVILSVIVAVAAGVAIYLSQNDTTPSAADFAESATPAAPKDERVKESEVPQIYDSDYVSSDPEAPDPSEVTYQYYENDRFCFSVNYPTFLNPEPAPENNDGRIFALNDKTYIQVYACYNNFDETIEDLYQQDRSSSDTYFRCSDNWYVVSGNKSDGTIYYTKTYLMNGTIYTLHFSYTQNEKALFDEVIPFVMDSWSIAE